MIPSSLIYEVIVFGVIALALLYYRSKLKD